MYFGRDGAVSACCYSRDAAIGRIPEQTIEQIWRGAQAASMRASLRRGQLPAGCDLCADQLYAGNFTGLLAKQFDLHARPPVQASVFSQIKSLLHPVSSPRFPTQLEFELSNKCNLECAMCSGFFSSSIRSNRENLPPLPMMYDSSFVDQLVPYLPHLTHAKFLGGEPFLIDIYYEIWEKLIELNPQCQVSITTNGSVYTEKVRRVLEKLNCSIILSLDSVVKPTYEIIRKNATLERALANFEVFCEFNRSRRSELWIAICPMTINAEEIPGLVDFASKRGVRVFFNTVVFPAAYSLRAASKTRQRDLLKLYRDGRAAPSNDVEAANLRALDGFCHQLEYWMQGTAEVWPFTKRCLELLDTEAVPKAYRTLLMDLTENPDGNNPHSLVTLDADPINAVKNYFDAMWYIGALLQQEGLLPDAEFDLQQKHLFMEQIMNKMSSEQASKVYPELRRFPKTVLQMVGRQTASQLGDLMDQHLAAPAHNIHDVGLVGSSVARTATVHNA